MRTGSNFDVAAAYELAVYYAHHDLAVILSADPRFKPNQVIQKPTEIILSGRKILETDILVAGHLGSFDLRSETKQVSVEGLEDFNIRIHSKQARPVCVDLAPTEIVLDDFNSKVSFSFYLLTSNVAQSVIEFDFVVDNKVRAKAVQKLNTTPESLWHENKPLGGRLEIPVYSFEMGIIGNITFEYTIVKPFLHADDGGAKFGGNKTVLVGHRGAGANRKINVDGKSRLQLGENTVESLIKGGEFGADFVEFDVQLTQDLTTTEFGVHSQVSNISYNDFVSYRPKISRRNSDSHFSKHAQMDVIKPNGPVFQKVPLKTGFNIEVKYPNLEEAQEETLYHAEINTFCDEILQVVFKNAGNRKVYFSSFHPEMCLLLKLKQKKYPVFYLTVAGAKMYYDVRLNSLAEAVKVAQDFKLDGVVTYCGPLIECPGLIKKIQNLGLNILSYGGKNNSTEDAKVQVDAGINGIIVDNVPDIYRVINQ
ncbi:Glycerophosphocholine phosphodiesterase [Terramyces sp. JEL0728]|nr:Glycerophosphocholine phosphodiesterase [Terramyces sp. JEL0728]